ncbi:hypothetical protein [Streptomyces sp. NEAU-NA10]|uniref:hypothetical protein n=1 Tax=Streptomyces sp. NEAU-NA10 TaxID=3416050 RepID=UPI003CC53F14
MDKFELTITDVGNIVRDLRAVPAEEPQPVVVFDPVTGTWVIKWVIPDPHPLTGVDRTDIDYATITDESVGALRESMESLKTTASPAQMLLLSADLVDHARAFEAVGRVEAASSLEVEASTLVGIALSRLGRR